MKTLSTLLSILLFTSMANAQTNVVLNIEHRLNQSPFAFNTTAVAPGGYEFNVSRLQYYISDITLIHDGGQSTPVADTWILVNAGNSADFNLGSHSVTSIEGINFHIGVGPDANHLDPSTYSASHALAPKNPSMHWGWSAGYRFVAMEGHAGENTAFGYEVHALGDNNYNEVNIVTDAAENGSDMVITIYADYARALNGVNVSNGLTLHAETGAAITFLNNFASHVFFPASALGVAHIEFEGTFDLYPNPTENASQIAYQLQNNAVYTVSVFGADGKLIHSGQLRGIVGNYELPTVSAGTYSVVLNENGTKVAARKWVVIK